MTILTEDLTKNPLLNLKLIINPPMTGKHPKRMNAINVKVV